MIATALLHDSREDAFIPTKVLLNLFGDEVAGGVLLLSKKIPAFDPRTGMVVAWAKKSPEEYYKAIASVDPSVRLVKCADRLDNVSDFGGWTDERKRKYVVETRTYVLPIAGKTDPWFAAKIESTIEEAERQLFPVT